MVHIKRVQLVGAELSFQSEQFKIVCNRERPTVEEYVVVRAKADDVVRRITAIVRLSERADVCRLSVRRVCLCVSSGRGT